MSPEFPNEVLVKIALEARNHAISPYSNYRVGAALQTGPGRVITAGNIESSSYGLTLCAERVALFSALADGYRKFRKLAIATDNRVPPCGACRQVLWEYAGNIEILLVDTTGEFTVRALRDLFPSPFDKSNLDKSKESP